MSIRQRIRLWPFALAAVLGLPSLAPAASAQVPPQAPPGQPALQPGVAGYYYYCDAAKAYYPSVASCPAGWIAIPVGAPPPPAFVGNPPPNPDLEREEADQVRSRPNAITAEIFGRALVYSLDYDRAISDHVTLGIGFSMWPESVRWHDHIANIAVVPLYANYYFSVSPSRGYLSAGLDLLKATSTGGDTGTFANSGVAGTVGGGYEYRDGSGFLFRLGGYLIVGRSVDLSPAINLGFAF